MLNQRKGFIMKRTKDYGKLFSIGEVSKICNISAKTLRYYDQIGILSPDVVLKENGYRYYSQKTLHIVPVVKYYKQMGFKLEEMQGAVEGNAYYYLEQDFRNKIKELKIREKEIRDCYTSVNDWNKMLEEARLVRQNRVQDVMIKYVQGETYCFQEQDFHYNYLESIINIGWVNYLDSIENQITGPVILNYCSYKEKMTGKSRRVRIMQKPILEFQPGANKITLDSGLFISVYHIGALETLDHEYVKIEQWAGERGYQCGEECYERHVVDYWATRNQEEFVTEIMIPVKKL